MSPGVQTLRDRESDVCPDRVNQKEPDLEAIRFYLRSSSRQHLPKLTRSKKSIIGRQCQQFSPQNDKLLFCRRDKVLPYVESGRQRPEILREVHE